MTVDGLNTKPSCGQLARGAWKRRGFLNQALRQTRTLTTTTTTPPISSRQWFLSLLPCSAASTANTSSSGDKDVEVAEPPTDSISSVSSRPRQTIWRLEAGTIAFASMKSVLRDNPKERRCTSTKGPCWMSAGTSGLQDGTKIFSGGADNAGRMFDVTTGQATQVAQHDAPIKVVGWVDAPGTGILATGSWDKTIKVRGHSACFYIHDLLNIVVVLVLGFTNAEPSGLRYPARPLLYL
ncbi:hypothetical protein NMY22_g17856 [Coprinellus aureogranulatus]|nr:hypothetical protein NMY22_g17856 [Coprinellus aureogranulatus]